jgi:hypothetical protein
MKSNKFKTELNKIAKKNRNKYLYFCWRNKVNNAQTKFSEMSKEDFLDRYKKTFSELNLNLYKTSWEGSEEYDYLYSLLMQLRSHKDLYKIYNVVKDKALTGDDKAVKTFLMLKEEINKTDIDIKNLDVPQKDNEVKNEIDDLDISEE